MPGSTVSRLQSLETLWCACSSVIRRAPRLILSIEKYSCSSTITPLRFSFTQYLQCSSSSSLYKKLRGSVRTRRHIHCTGSNKYARAYDIAITSKLELQIYSSLFCSEFITTLRRFITSQPQIFLGYHAYCHPQSNE